MAEGVGTYGFSPLLCAKTLEADEGNERGNNDELNNEKLNNDGENAEVRFMVSIIIHRGRWVKVFMLFFRS